MFRICRDNFVIGDLDDLELAKQFAEDDAGVHELIWNQSHTGDWWSDEVDGGRKIGNIYYIFDLPAEALAQVAAQYATC